jgi:murein DD-endopeptidase MepM/ murein hydrolase activator NlpD
MLEMVGRRCGAAGGIARVAGLALLVAACGPRTEEPAPVLSRGAVIAPAVEIEVRRGQTLSGIAHAYHIPMQVVAEANQLAPPYHIEAGQTLIIPSAGQPAMPPAPALPASPPPPSPETATGPTSPAAVALDRTTAAAVGTPPAAAPGPAISTPAPVEATKPVASQEPTPKPERPPSSAQAGGSLLWPVHGRVVAGYGSGPDGTHNDGINIAAPRGAPVEAVDAGVVAYAGNELRGYGNLLLVKHPNGWISAYAHCDQMLVKRGDKVARGQVIARVGSTGNVTGPQLHFELRRGNRPVDPREFLSPQPTATSREHPGPG